MTIVEYYNIPIDDLEKKEVIHAEYMKELVGDEYYKLSPLPQISLKESLLKTIFTFNKYKSDRLSEELYGKVTQWDYLPSGDVPFCFDFKMLLGVNEQMNPTVLRPDVYDRASYAFFGNAYHKALKGMNPEEIKLRDRLNDVIPLFYEIMCSDDEYSEDVSKEILRRRILLLQAEKEDNDEVDCLECFNSYYYALALHNVYRDNKVLVLRLIERVLMGEISTLDLLNALDIYDNDSDYLVSWELEMIKQYILK